MKSGFEWVLSSNFPLFSIAYLGAPNVSWPFSTFPALFRALERPCRRPAGPFLRSGKIPIEVFYHRLHPGLLRRHKTGPAEQLRPIRTAIYLA